MLSPRELEVAKLACTTSLTEGGIAKGLGIKPGTVKTHLRTIYRKLQIRRGIIHRVQMILMFLDDIGK